VLQAAGAMAAPPSEYQQPPAELLALADARPPPRVLSASRQQVRVLPGQTACPPLAGLAAPGWRLGGLRTDARTRVANAITLSDNRPIRPWFAACHFRRTGRSARRGLR